MSYDLDQFVADCRAILERDPGPKGREEVRLQLEHLLANKDFIEKYCGEGVPRGLKVLYDDPDWASRFSPTSMTRRGCRRRTTMARHGRSTARPPITPT